jgi:cyclin A
MSVQRAKLQLVGTACMFIASKYEEIYPPDVGEFVYITDDTYNKRQVLRMEHLVLKVLGFDLSAPSSHLFVSQLGQMSNTDEKTQHLAMYLNELSLMSGENFLRYSPSLVAAASLALARHTMGAEAWPASVAESSGIAVSELQECLLALHAVYVQAEDCPQQAVREKYKSSK